MNGFKYLLGKKMVLGIWVYLLVWPVFPNAHGIETDVILNKMKKSYATVEDYQTDVLVRRYDGEKTPEEKRFTYRFKKPEKIRIDFHSPYAGTVLVYPNAEGKVVVQPFPGLPFIKLTLDLDSSLISDPSGQRIDQTPIGLLIRNIERSLTEERLGRPEFQESEKTVEIRVLAENHFRRSVTTLYRFEIEKKNWLPTAIDERTPEGSLKREVRFRNLKTNLGISDRLFTLEE
jgi:outer membrane lipoprotein-sorting protein